MELNVLNEQGNETAKLAASDAVFGREYNEALVHQIVVAYQANARQGTRAQLTRADVHHSTKKPWRQKGTGRSPQRYDEFSGVAWRRSRFPEYAERKLRSEGQQEDVPCRYGRDLLQACC